MNEVMSVMRLYYTAIPRIHTYKYLLSSKYGSFAGGWNCCTLVLSVCQSVDTLCSFHTYSTSVDYSYLSKRVHSIGSIYSTEVRNVVRGTKRSLVWSQGERMFPELQTFRPASSILA